MALLGHQLIRSWKESVKGVCSFHTFIFDYPFPMQPSIGKQITLAMISSEKSSAYSVISVQLVRYMLHHSPPSSDAFINGSSCQMLPDEADTDADASHESGN